MDQEIIKAGSSVLGKAYDDLVHPSAQSLGNTISLLPRSIGVWFRRWERWVINGEESVSRTIDTVGERVSGIPEEHLVEPPSHVAVPAIQQLAYCYDSEELREMYAKLLLSSMDDRSAGYVHPSFVQILKQLSPDEAKLLGTFTPEESDGFVSIPLLDLRIVSSDQVVPYSWRTIVDGYNECCVGVCEHPEQALVYLNNLERLGILQRNEFYTDRIKEKLEAFEECEAISLAKDGHPLGEGERYDCRRWSYRVTDFGANFLRTCVEGAGGSPQSSAE